MHLQSFGLTANANEHFMKKPLLIFVTIFCFYFSTCAYDFKSGEIYYNIISDSVNYTVEVTYNDTTYYADTVILPNSVLYNGINYSVRAIGDHAFAFCQDLTYIEMPVSINWIKEYAFYGCTGLTSVFIPDSVSTISGNAFSYCSNLDSLYIGNSVSWIGNRTFEFCTALVSVAIPNAVEAILNNSFTSCTSLNYITLGASLESIGKESFYNTNLLRIILKSHIPPTVYEYALGATSRDIPVIIPCGTTAAYQAAPSWSEFTNFIEDCSGIEESTSNSITVYGCSQNIIIGNAGKNIISIYDLSGRCIYSASANNSECYIIPVKTIGIYLVKVGNTAAKKVVVY